MILLPYATVWDTLYLLHIHPFVQGGNLELLSNLAGARRTVSVGLLSPGSLCALEQNRATQRNNRITQGPLCAGPIWAQRPLGPGSGRGWWREAHGPFIWPMGPGPMRHLYAGILALLLPCLLPPTSTPSQGAWVQSPWVAEPSPYGTSQALSVGIGIGICSPLI